MKVSINLGGPLALLTILLATLKLTGVWASLSWFWVLFPIMLIPVITVAILICVFSIVGFSLAVTVSEMFGSKKNK